jgi:hypothetical protein
MPQSNVWHILGKTLCVKGYWLQLLQVLNPQDHNLCFQFCVDFQQRLEEDGFAENIVFSDEATFHVCSTVNCHNVRIWGTEILMQCWNMSVIRLSECVFCCFLLQSLWIIFSLQSQALPAPWRLLPK